MALELVTGHWGMEHVTAEQDADLNAGIIGSGNYVLNIGEKMRAEAVSANQVRIFDGVFMAYGRQCILGDGEYEDVTIENGTPGLVRNDMIVVKYKKDEESGKENATFAVLKGETGSVAKDPVPNRQDIRSGAFESEVPMYRVKINGLAIEKIEALFDIPMTNDDLSTGLEKVNKQLAVKARTIEGSYLTAQVVEYGNLVWFRISANTKTTLNKGTEYKPFSISSSAPLFSVYRRITIDELKSFNFKIDQSGQVTITPNVQIPEGTGVNVSELYLKK